MTRRTVDSVRYCYDPKPPTPDADEGMWESIPALHQRMHEIAPLRMYLHDRRRWLCDKAWAWFSRRFPKAAACRFTRYLPDRGRMPITVSDEE